MSDSDKRMWFRLYSETVDDEKLRMLAFEDRWHFIALLCCKGQGILETDGILLFRKVAVKLGLDLRALEEVARRLEEVGLIDAKTLQPIAWDSRQRKSDTDDTVAERQRRFREKNTKRVSNALRNGTVTCTETETETDISTDVDIKKTRASRFDAQAHLLSIGVPEQIARDWLTHRKAKRAAPTQTAIERISKEAAKARIALSDALSISCQRGWVGFEAAWISQVLSPTPSNDRRQTAAETRANTIAELTGRKLHEQPQERDITADCQRLC